MKRLAAIILIHACLAAAAYSADLIPTGPQKTTAFYSQSDVHGWKVIVRGRAESFSVRMDPDSNDLLGRVREKSKITVRLFSREGIKNGDELFVIDDRNLITARIKVISIYKSRSFGYMLAGYGNFRLCALNDRVVQRLSEGYSDYARVYRGRGDHYLEKGDRGAAIAEYKKALELDRGNPETHLALGYVYLEQGLLQFAFREFMESYKTMGRLYDNEDRYRLLKGMADIRFREVFQSYLPEEKREGLKNEGIAYCKEALAVYPDSVEINYFLGRFFYRKSTMPEDEDRTARDYFLKVVELQPQHVKANVALSELYFKHRNREKARFYASRALKDDPRNERARQILDYLETRNR